MDLAVKGKIYEKIGNTSAQVYNSSDIPTFTSELKDSNFADFVDTSSKLSGTNNYFTSKIYKSKIENAGHQFLGVQLYAVNGGQHDNRAIWELAGWEWVQASNDQQLKIYVSRESDDGSIAVRVNAICTKLTIGF